MITWIVKSRLVFDKYDLANILRAENDKSILIDLDTRAELFTVLGHPHADGYYDPAHNLYKIVILDSLTSPSIAQATVVHEYFHLAQRLTKPETEEEGESMLEYGSSWLVESTAVWFEDYMYDESNAYIDFFDGQIDSVLRRGVDTYESNDSVNQYRGAIFFKMLASKCSKFEENLKHLLFADYKNKSSTAILSDWVANAGCDFGKPNGGTTPNKLLEAFSFYQYATQYAAIDNGKMTLIDDNETDATFNYEDVSSPYSALSFKQSITHTEFSFLDDGRTYQGTLNIDLPANSARTFEFSALWDFKETYQDWLLSTYPERFLVWNLEAGFRIEGDPELGDEELIDVVIMSEPSGTIGNDEKGSEYAFVGNYISDEKSLYFTDQRQLCGDEYIFRKNTEEDGFLTLANRSEVPIQNVKLSFFLRDHQYYKDEQKKVSRSRYENLEFEDDPELVTREMTWEEANAACGAKGWRLPTADEYFDAALQIGEFHLLPSNMGQGAFIHHDPTALSRYWVDSPAYVRHGSITANTVLQPSDTVAHVRCVRDIVDANSCVAP